MRTLDLALLLSAPALAAPPTMTWQGRLLDASGNAVSGEQTIRVDLYDSPTGVSQWHDEFTRPVESGFVSLVLGSDAPLPLSLFSGGDVYITSTAAGVTSERTHLTSVPFALVAGGVAVDTGPPSPTCTTDGALVYDDGVDGGLRMCDGGAWTWLSGGPAQGGVQVGSASTCNPDLAGTLRWASNRLEVCNGTAFTAVGLDSGRQVFSHYEYYSTNQSYGTSWTTGKTWTQHTIPGNTELHVQAHIPGRNDTGGWNGCYTEIQASVNGGAWTSMGDSGYDLMDSSGNTIDSMNYSFIWDPGQTSDYTVQFRMRHRSYAGTCWINTNHGISITGQTGFGFENITIQAFSK